MAVYDLQEQDQLDDLKAWWNRWGNAVTTAIAVVLIAFAAVQGWRWWNVKQTEEASALFSGMSLAVRANDLAKAKDAALLLEDRFARTGYAPRAALVVAKMQFDAGDGAAARVQLQWVIDRASETELKEIARYRLAEIMLNDKQYDEVLKILDAKHGEPFAGLYADLRGDALAEAGRSDDARAAYQTAITKLDAKSQYRTYVQVKLDSLGAVTTGAGAAPVTGSAAAPASAAAAPAVPKK